MLSSLGSRFGAGLIGAAILLGASAGGAWAVTSSHKGMESAKVFHFSGAEKKKDQGLFGFDGKSSFSKSGKAWEAIKVGKSSHGKGKGIFDDLVKPRRGGGKHGRPRHKHRDKPDMSPVPAPAPFVLLLGGLAVAAFATRGKREKA